MSGASLAVSWGIGGSFITGPLGLHLQRPDFCVRAKVRFISFCLPDPSSLLLVQSRPVACGLGMCCAPMTTATPSRSPLFAARDGWEQSRERINEGRPLNGWGIEIRLQAMAKVLQCRLAEFRSDLQ